MGRYQDMPIVTRKNKTATILQGFHWVRDGLTETHEQGLCVADLPVFGTCPFRDFHMY